MVSVIPLKEMMAAMGLVLLLVPSSMRFVLLLLPMDSFLVNLTSLGAI